MANDFRVSMKVRDPLADFLNDSGEVVALSLRKLVPQFIDQPALTNERLDVVDPGGQNLHEHFARPWVRHLIFDDVEDADPSELRELNTLGCIDFGHFSSPP